MSTSLPDANPPAPEPEPSIPPAAVFGPGSSPPRESRISTKRVLIAALPLVALIGWWR
jgi:hypothetical protein